MTIHASHPKCSGCGKALYKSMEKGARVSPVDLYQYCRNANCQFWGYRETDDVSEDATGTSEVMLSESPQATSHLEELEAQESAALPSSPVVGIDADEPFEVRLARGRIKALIDTWNDKSLVSVGIVLAILNQETGHHEAANALIDQYGLEKLGLRKFGKNGEPLSGTDLECDPSGDG